MDEFDTTTVEVYPNPAKGMIQVKTHSEGEALLRVVDLTGKVVYECSPSTHRQAQGSGTATIETSKFGGSGIYTLQVIQNGNVSNVRIVVMP